MSLTDLSLELLQAVIQHAYPEGFESFALTCQSAYQASRLYLDDYNRFARRYRRFRYDHEEHDEEHPRDSLSLVLAIAHTPLIAELMVEADFRHELVPDSGPPGGQMGRTLGDEANRGALRRLLQASGHVQDAQLEPDDWLDWLASDSGVLETKQFFVGAFLLTLLPRVETLTLPAFWGRAAVGRGESAARVRCTRSLLHTLPRRARSDDPALARLASLLPHNSPGYDARNSLDLLDPFLALPSLRSFAGCSFVALVDDYTGLEFAPVQAAYPGLDTIVLDATCASATQLAKLLSRTPSLRVFDFSFEIKWHGCGSNWDAGAFVHMLETHVGATLEELRIATPGPSIDTSPVSLKGFRRLQQLSLDVAILSSSPYRYNDIDYSEFDDEAPVEEMEVPHIGDLLPPSIETVTLDALFPDDAAILQCLRRLFEDFATERYAKLPNLKQIQLEYGTRAQHQELRSLLEDIKTQGVDCRET